MTSIFKAYLAKMDQTTWEEYVLPEKFPGLLKTISAWKYSKNKIINKNILKKKKIKLTKYSKKNNYDICSFFFLLTLILL